VGEKLAKKARQLLVSYIQLMGAGGGNCQKKVGALVVGWLAACS
jgi:hypothetical protein